MHSLSSANLHPPRSGPERTGTPRRAFPPTKRTARPSGSELVREPATRRPVTRSAAQGRPVPRFRANFDEPHFVGNEAVTLKATRMEAKCRRRESKVAHQIGCERSHVPDDHDGSQCCTWQLIARGPAGSRPPRHRGRRDHGPSRSSEEPAHASPGTSPVNLRAAAWRTPRIRPRTGPPTAEQSDVVELSVPPWRRPSPAAHRTLSMCTSSGSSLNSSANGSAIGWNPRPR